MLLQQEFESLFLLEKKMVFEKSQNADNLCDLFSCPIGSDVIFVSSKGEFHMCMRSDYSFQLGDVESGYNKEAIVSLYKRHINGFRQKSKKCWAIHFCNICPAQTLYKNTFRFPNNIECKTIQKTVLVLMKKYIMLSQKEQLFEMIRNLFNESNSKYVLDSGHININSLNF